MKFPADIDSFFMLPFHPVQGGRDSLALLEDTGLPLEVRKFPEQLNQKYTGKEFEYTVQDGEAQNYFLRAINVVMDWLQDVFGIQITEEGLHLLRMGIYILLVLVGIYFIIRILSGNNASSIFRKKALPIHSIDLQQEHIEHIDLEALVRAAESKKDYRLAARYHFLKALKILSQKQVIAWHYKKTNREYEQEITMPQLKKLFRETAYLYDHIWYGEQYLDEEKYRAAAIKFRALINSDLHGQGL